MKQFLSVFLFVFAMSLFAQNDLNVMSYNIRLGSAQDGENSWDLRKEKLVDLLEYYEADFIGLQEVQKFQLDYILSKLSEYSSIGLPREEGEWAEYSCILYRKKSFDVVEEKTLWLSETPEKMTKGWDAVCYRIVTYGRFKNKNTNKEYWMANTHFDHQGLQARENSAKLIVDLCANLLKIKTIPFILTGDFNAPKEEKTISILKENLFDSYETSSKKPYGPTGTWNAFHFHEKISNRIDYVFYSRKSNLKVNKIAIIDDFYDSKYPSDHLPVLVNFE